MKEKILYIVLAVSIGINVGFLTSIIYIKFNRPDMDCQPFEFRGKPKYIEKFRKMEDSVRRMNEPYIFAIEEARENLFETLKTENPDTHLVDSLLLNISMIQMNMEKNIVRNIIGLKNQISDADKKMLMDFLEGRSKHYEKYKKFNNK